MGETIMSLTKACIVEKIYHKIGFSKTESTEFVEIIFNIMKDALADGNKIKILCFGSFILRDKATRMGRNPQTGKPARITPRRVLSFKVSRALKDDLASRYGHRISDSGHENFSLRPREGTSKALSSFISTREI